VVVSGVRRTDCEGGALMSGYDGANSSACLVAVRLPRRRGRRARSSRIAGGRIPHLSLFTSLLRPSQQSFKSELTRFSYAALAARHALPTIHDLQVFTATGGLVSYGISLAETYRRAGSYVGSHCRNARSRSSSIRPRWMVPDTPSACVPALAGRALSRGSLVSPLRLCVS
jgi:hypothetical protein